MNGQFWQYVRDPALQTLGIAAGSLAIALLFGAPAALAIVRGGIAGRAVKALAAFVRAIPDLVLAIMLVVAVGLGPAAGTLALGISYASVVAKLYAEILESTRREPEEALRATGSTVSAAFLVGLLPAAWPSLVGFGGYTFESIIRASVIVGAVGAGGLGAQIVQAINLADYPQFALYLTAIIVLVWTVDIASAFLRRAPAWAAFAALGTIGVVGAIAFAQSSELTWTSVLGGLPRLGLFIVHAFPPEFSPRVIRTATGTMLETLGIAFVGTFAGALIAIPLAWLAARPIARGWMRGTGYHPWSILPSSAARALLAVVRAVPVVATGLVALAFVGIGPRAGIVALVIHTAGVLGKLLSESLEAGERAPAEALVAGGATASAAAIVGLLPGTFGAMLAHLLYRWEWNVRASTILGMVGAGGIGGAIYNSQQLLFYHQLIAYVSLVIVVVLLSDWVSATLRARFSLRVLER